MGKGDIWPSPCIILLCWRRCIANISGIWIWFIPSATSGTFAVSLLVVRLIR